LGSAEATLPLRRRHGLGATVAVAPSSRRPSSARGAAAREGLLAAAVSRAPRAEQLDDAWTEQAGDGVSPSSSTLEPSDLLREHAGRLLRPSDLLWELTGRLPRGRSSPTASSNLRPPDLL
jgi:hypothetical protein